MVTAELCILGPPSFTINGRAVRLHSIKAIALLAYLVCEAEVPHSRAKLSALFWADAAESGARQSLRQVLYSLRRALGELADVCLVVERDVVTFQPHPDFLVDVSDFERCAAQKNRSSQSLHDLRHGVSLYRGPLLEGITLDDCPEIDEWLFLERERLGQQAIQVLQLTIDGCLAVNEVDQALGLGRRLLALDNLNEGAHRWLMRIHAAQGDRDAVKRQYRQCTDILTAELGVEPTAETTALLEELVTNAVVAPVTVVPPPTPTLALGFYQGCQHELAELMSSWAQAVAGRLSLVLVRGESGMGKTQLVSEFIRRTSDQQPLRRLRGRCYEAELGAPYTMWSDALSPLGTAEWQPLLQDLPDIWRQQLARLIPGLARSLDEIVDLTAAENQLRLMQGVVQGLAHLAQARPLLLFFDDIHWADAASLELLHYASRHLVTTPILFIGTYRPEVVTDNLHLQTILRETSPPTIEVMPIDPAGVCEWLAQLNVTVSPGMASRLHRHCGGNRFVLIETIRMLLDDGKLSQTAGDEPLPLPPRVQDSIQSRIATLSDINRRLLAAAAVVGRSCDLILLRQVSGQPEVELLDQVDDLLKRAFLSETTEGSGQEALTFSHDFIRQVAYQGLRRSQRQALHRRTAEALLALYHRHPQTVTEEIAYHYEQAVHPEALKYLRQAAQQAEALCAIPHATDLTTRALAFQARYLGDPPGQRFELLLARESLLDQQARRAEQAADIAALVRLAEAMDDPQYLALAYVRQAGHLSNTHQPTQSHAVAEKAVSLYRGIGDRPGEAQALRELCFLYWFTSNYGMALEYGRAALQLHRQLGDLAGEATALHNLAEIYQGLNNPRQALAHFQQALDQHWARQDHRRQGLTLYGIAHTLRQMGDRAAARNRYEQALTQTEAAGDRLMTSRVHHALASLIAQAGQSETALEHLQRAVEISQAIGYAPGMAHGLVDLSYLYARTHQPDAAREALRDALYWFQLMEDQVWVEVVSRRRQQLDHDPASMDEPPSHLGWIKSHVTLNEGKVYCEFESPLARESQGFS